MYSLSRKKGFLSWAHTISSGVSRQARTMYIQSIPMWRGSSDNYAYLVVDEKSKEAVVIDPAHPVEVIPILKEKIINEQISITAIINTHHFSDANASHHDHAGGNHIMASSEPALPWFKNSLIVGGKDCQDVEFTPMDGRILQIGEVSIKALYTPCHTHDSICWFVEDGEHRAVFTGDTLFHGGCGRFFEGTAAEMNTALNEILASLPDNTIVYPGHEYTKTNSRFAVSVLPNQFTKRLRDFAEKNEHTQGRFTIADEKMHNVFMRLEDPVIQKATGETDVIEVMCKLREMKNNFK
ncbi:putative hydroxyacylglutathione hydrolase [Golovinomyces cichoracearum]|uniref:hydroxyacylglutathione hydrolase n=1 Tax=Golovinomyces cichoracearum TaxID=62708 RepID=A0A420IRH1_9PEZI|nr:putative hydroxyacylglutathione hydrolase [Golovinomyces cichoracearum]